MQGTPKQGTPYRSHQSTPLTARGTGNKRPPAWKFNPKSNPFSPLIVKASKIGTPPTPSRLPPVQPAAKNTPISRRAMQTLQIQIKRAGVPGKENRIPATPAVSAPSDRELVSTVLERRRKSMMPPTPQSAGDSGFKDTPPVAKATPPCTPMPAGDGDLAMRLVFASPEGNVEQGAGMGLDDDSTDVDSSEKVGSADKDEEDALVEGSEEAEEGSEEAEDFELATEPGTSLAPLGGLLKDIAVAPLQVAKFVLMTYVKLMVFISLFGLTMSLPLMVERAFKDFGHEG